MTTQKICVQGLGFVGAAMAIAVANARTDSGTPAFRVVGVDLDSPDGNARIDALNEGRFPFGTEDTSLQESLSRAIEAGNLLATHDAHAYADADVVVVDVQFDVDMSTDSPTLDLAPFRRAITAIGERIPETCLVIVETTVPPGTCQKITLPLLKQCFSERGLNPENVLLAHSYERVMPGRDYLSSIVNYWRVYSGCNDTAADACARFLSQVINTKDYPLTRLSCMTASETAKVLENSYRAVNIAFIEEWGRFAELAGINMFEILDAVRMRPTHNNIRQPGFGVGGYCLTKDPLLAPLSATTILGLGPLSFPFSLMAVQTNAKMPEQTLSIIDHALGGLHRKKILLLGVSYREDVSDTRYSPSQTFVDFAERAGATVRCQDPMVGFWPEKGIEVTSDLSCCPDVDAVVFAVRHQQYLTLVPKSWLDGRRPLIVDANNVLSNGLRSAFEVAGCPVVAVGRGAPAIEEPDKREAT